MTSLAWGVVFAGLGVVGRGVYEAQQTLGKHDTLGLRFVLAWVLVGLLGAPFGAALVLYGLKLASVQSDNITAFALMFMGFTGPKGVTFVFSAAGDFFNKKFGLSGPGAIPPPIQGGQKDGN